MDAQEPRRVVTEDDYRLAQQVAVMLAQEVLRLDAEVRLERHLPPREVEVSPADVITWAAEQVQAEHHGEGE